MRVLLALLLAALFPAMLAAQSAAPPAAAQPLELATRFDPPLDKTLRYKVTQEREKAGKIEASAIEQEVSYRRDGDGVVMTVRPVSIASGGKTFNLNAPGIPVPPTLKPLLEAVELDLDADGSIVRVRNWDAYKARLEASIPAMLETIEPDAKERAQYEPALRQFFANYLAVGPEGAPQVMLKGWPDVLGIMGASGAEGEDQVFENEVTTPFSSEPIRTEVVMRLARLEQQNALRIEVNSAPDPEAFRRLIRTVVDSLASAAPANKPIDQAEMEREFAAMDLSMTMEVELDASTGLVRRGVISRSIKMNEGSGTNRITIEAQ